jgi:hypothetical protein
MENSPTNPHRTVVRYLGWLSITAKCFNVGNYRRHDTPQPTADFFDTNNKEGERLRRACCGVSKGTGSAEESRDEMWESEHRN